MGIAVNWFKICLILEVKLCDNCVFILLALVVLVFIIVRNCYQVFFLILSELIYFPAEINNKLWIQGE